MSALGEGELTAEEGRSRNERQLTKRRCLEDSHSTTVYACGLRAGGGQLPSAERVLRGSFFDGLLPPTNQLFRLTSQLSVRQSDAGY